MWSTRRCRAYSVPAGYATRHTVAQNVDGSTTVDVNAFNPDGSLANETEFSTSLLGLEVTMVGSTMGPLALRSVTVRM
ncbi:hypothetical protein [Bradyrhizobium sp. AZCC 2230]|uniref:hypothetical protein n=1 Tax=Bradyrhizobium sp. AZCC 2230 TaxID=3117021 RepID=UPI002FF32358